MVMSDDARILDAIGELRSRADVVSLCRRMERVELDVKALERDISDAHAAAKRDVSSSDLKHASDIAAVIEHVQALQGVVASAEKSAKEREAQLAAAVVAMQADATARAEVAKRIERRTRHPWMKEAAKAVILAASAYFATRGAAPSNGHDRPATFQHEEAPR
jgi:hypothetical protein